MKTLRNSLLYFDQAVRDGSIRAAAESLHVASSAVNRQILELEQEIGVPLFERLPRGIRPTAAGEMLLAYVRRWRREAIALDHEIKSLAGGVRGTLRIAAAESITEKILPLALQKLQEQFPLVEYAVISGDNKRITAELSGKDADVVIAFDVNDNSKGEVVYSFSSPLGVIAKVDHPLMAKKVISLADTTPYPLVIPGDEWLQASGLGVLLRKREAPTRIAARAERPGMLKAMVRSGVGIAFLTRFGVGTGIAGDGLAWRPLVDGTIPPANIGVLVPRGVAPKVYTTVFIDILQRLLQEGHT